MTTVDASAKATPSAGDLETVLTGLRAASEATRLRIVAALDEGELTVSELCRILGQTQPRVSRHLKLLCNAGLLDRHSEGTSAFYSKAGAEPGRSIFASVLNLIDTQDRTLAADRARLEAIRTERANAAGQYFEQIAERWDGIRSRHVADVDVEQVLLGIAADHHAADGLAATHDDTATNQTTTRIGNLLDIGTGTGRILELFADRIDHGLGIDLSKSMLNLARTNLLTERLDHCTVRHGNVYAIDVPDGSFDLAILHHVLHYLDEPDLAIAAASATLRQGGQLIIVDFAPHQLETLRTEHAHRRLGFEEQQVTSWCDAAGLGHVSATHLEPPPSDNSSDSGDSNNLLTVSLWSATRTPDRRAGRQRTTVAPQTTSENR